jgi:aerobic carbon-monoxide dehydrogenase small subunit
MPDRRAIRVAVNGRVHERTVEPRLLLSDFLRHHLRLTGTHVGCEHGVCGACTVLVDGEPARSCLLLAVQTDGASITTVEGLSAGAEPLHPIQEAFWDAHGLQCGFCTSGMLMTSVALLRDNPGPSDDEIRSALSGNLCRCTGYQNIVKAVRLAAARLAESPLPLGEAGRSPGEGGFRADKPPSPPPSPRGSGGCFSA